MSSPVVPALIEAAVHEPLWSYRSFLKRLEGYEIPAAEGTGAPGGVRYEQVGRKERRPASLATVGSDKTKCLSGGGEGFVSVIGHSEKGRPLLGGVFGSGPCTISLMAGAHADEPVGPNTLYRLVLSLLEQPEKYTDWLEGLRLLVIPHLNPDGDENNRFWMERWPSLQAYVSSVKRELPGRDLEFGFPSMRVENRAATAFWHRHEAPQVHVSLHGMGFSEGFLLLVNREKAGSTEGWRAEYARFMAGQGLFAHDHNRAGEKGFEYLGPGFTTTPRGEAMRRFFRNSGQHAMAGRFHDSSMEHHLARNADALCLVTELPLFLLSHSGCNGKPANYLSFKKALSEANVEQVAPLAERFGATPLPVARAMYLQWYTVCMACEWAMDRARPCAGRDSTMP